MNDIFNRQTDSSEGDFGDLDALFASARESQPALDSSNFTKIVVNSLPERVKRSSKRSYAFDLAGLFLGLACIYFLTQLNFLSASIPQSVTLSLMEIMMLSGSLAAAVIGTWWVQKQ